MAFEAILNRYHALPRLTLFGRSLALIVCELLANAACWVVAGVLFGRNSATQPILSLALLSWTIGLRHALDADHISAIDNATRSLMNLGQLPVTCGLYFSLGHSTIVIVVNVAIAISTSVYERIDGVGRIGGIVGSAVSASFLFIVGLANSIILWRLIVKRRKLKQERELRIKRGEDPTLVNEELDDDKSHGNTLMMKIIGPVVTFVNQPWKMYPVGVLFGFGFDTASSIALLAVSAIAKKDTNGNSIPAGYIVVLPFLFTAGMTLIDSLDSIIMLYSYSGFPDRSFAIFERRHVPRDSKGQSTQHSIEDSHTALQRRRSSTQDNSDPEEILDVLEEIRREPVVGAEGRPMSIESAKSGKKVVDSVVVEVEGIEGEETRRLIVKRNAMSNLSVILTLMSILVAFSISLITVMGLIGDNCTPCQEAADAEGGGGLAGSWWRGWAKANDNSGYIGAAIVGAFVTIVATWYCVRYFWQKWHKSDATTPEEAHNNEP